MAVELLSVMICLAALFSGKLGTLLCDAMHIIVLEAPLFCD